MMNKITKHLADKKLFFIANLAAIFLCFLDLLSKRIIFAALENQDQIIVFPFFNLVQVWNHGVSFGMFNNLENAQIIFSLIVLAILIFMLLWLYRNKKKHIAIALSFIIGGALGNLFDRIQNAAVADFLDFHIAHYHWPAFNLADSFVFIGVVILLIDDFFLQKK